MSIPESCVGAARAPGDFELQNPHAEARARRVLKAASECVPDEAVNVALDAWYLTDDWRTEFSKELLEAVRTEMRAAISAALRKMAEE